MSKNYFSNDIEQAIIKYCLSQDRKEKEKLFIIFIEPCFKQLIEKIIYSYKFTNLPNINELKDECLLYLISVLHKFDPSRGSMAFSYFTRITINWFSFKYKEESKKKQMIRNLNAEPFIKEVKHQGEERMQTLEFLTALIKECESWKGENKKLDLIIEAIKDIISNLDKFDFLNKRVVFFSIKEITGLKTSELTYLMKKVYNKYDLFKQKWNNENA
jgi:hypothetical protein